MSKSKNVSISADNSLSGWNKFWLTLGVIFFLIGFLWSVGFVYSGVTYAIGWVTRVNQSLYVVQFEIDTINRGSKAFRIEPVIIK